MISELTNDDFYLIQINVFLFVYLKKNRVFFVKIVYVQNRTDLLMYYFFLSISNKI